MSEKFCAFSFILYEVQGQGECGKEVTFSPTQFSQFKCLHVQQGFPWVIQAYHSKQCVLLCIGQFKGAVSLQESADYDMYQNTGVAIQYLAIYFCTVNKAMF